MSSTEFLPYQDAPNIAAVAGFIDYAANHELKTVVSNVYMEEAGRLLTATAVARTSNAWQGPDPVWKLTAKDVIQYSERSLVKGGIVEQDITTGERGKEVAAWVAAGSPEEMLVRQALIGLFTVWGLDNPDLSVQKLYRVGGGDDARSPMVRHRLYDLLGDASTEQSIAGLGAVMATEGHHPRTLSTKIDTLKQEGIVVVRTKKFDHDPIITITDPEYRHVAIKLSETTPETQAAYAVFEKLGSNTSISVNELVEKALQHAPSINPVLMRRYIIGSLSTDTNHFPGLRLVDRHGMPITDLSVVTLADDIRDSVGELVAAVGEILAGENLTMYAKPAEQLAQNTNQVRELAAKAARFSAVKTGHFHGSPKLMRQMKEILSTGPQTSKDMRGELAKRYGREIGHHRIHVLLSGLVAIDAVTATDEKVHPYSDATRRVYRARS